MCAGCCCHPIEILKRQITTRRIKNSGQAYHLVLMQLEHDSAFLMHSPFAVDARISAMRH
jgi:capsular polysaccharide export protein